jgi:4-amino-4-deoxy-L-arabinose transferase-like glycosyltransferase
LVPLLAVAAANGLLWAILVPPWQSPDEPKHFEYVRLLAERGRLFAFGTEGDQGDPELQSWILDSMDAAAFWWYGHAPGYGAATRASPAAFRDAWEFGSHTAFYRSSPGYYALAARLQPDDRFAGLYAARLLGVLLGVVIVGCTALAAAEVFPDDELVRIGAPALVALSPMFAFTQAAVNSDVLANALAAFTVLVAVRLITRGGSVGRLVLLGAACLVSVLVKRTAFFVVPVSIVAVGSWLALKHERPARGLVSVAVGAGALLLAGASWLAAGGLAALPAPWLAVVTRYAFNEPDQPARIVAYLGQAGTWPHLADYIARVATGFWGVFGWESLRLPAAVYAVLGLAVVAAALGLVRRLPALQSRQLAVLLALVTAPVLVAVTAAAFFASYLYLPYAPPPQSRYLMAAVLPIAIVLTAGWSGFVNPARRREATRRLVAALVVYDVAVMALVVWPYYYGSGA